jgi:peptidoglycan/LPS O-acetylase OafA/YrhL
VIAIFPNLSGINIFYISFITTLILAVLSWHLLEKKVLMYKSSYFKFKDWLLNLKKIATR